MDKRFVVYVEHDDPKNNMEIECSDIKDMDHYANACREQGYKNVKTKAKPKLETFHNSVDQKYTVPMCPRCGEATYSKPACPFCKQEIEWGEQCKN